MKILIASSSSPDRGSGISAFAKDLSEELRSRGMHVIFMSPPPNNTAWLDQHHIRHIPTSQSDDPRATTENAFRNIKDAGIDAAINNDNPVLQSLAPALACPVLSVGHSEFGTQATLACRAHEWIDHVVAISYDLQKIFVTRHGVPVFKCPVILNGARDNGVPPRQDVDDDRPLRLIYSGGVVRSKGAHIIAAMVAAGNGAWESVHLECFGHLPRSAVKRIEKISNATVRGRVPRDEFTGALREADILLFRSRREACPMTILEAMESATVPIASDGNGAMRWMIDSGTDGFICPVEDWSAQAMDCVRFLATNRSVLRVMQAAARARFESEFRTSDSVSKLLDLLSRPTVDRRHPSLNVEALHWHRPYEPLRRRPEALEAPRASLLDRLVLRTASQVGYLRSAGAIDLSAV